MTSIATINRGELLARARTFSEGVENDQGFPYKEAVRDESDFFVGMLEDAKDGTLSEMKAAALATSADASKKAKYAAIGGMALLVASFVLPVPQGLGLLKLGGIAGGFYLSNMVAGKAANEAASQKKFANQLTEWEVALASQPAQPAPTQPTPAPVPAAPQTQPQA